MDLGKRHGRRTDREDVAEESTPAVKSPQPTLYSIFRRFYTAFLDAIATTVIRAAYMGIFGDYSHISIAASSSGHRYAAAVDIPPEFFDHILHFLRIPRAEDDYEGEQAGRNRVVVNKRELGQLALVCRRWAQLCQMKMYETIALRSLDDYRMLQMLESHLCSRISQYIKHLELEPYSKARPWIHTVCMQVRCPPPKQEGSPFLGYKGHRLHLRGNEGLSVLKRGLHGPPMSGASSTFSQGITQLYLDGIELPGIVEVARLSKTLPSLERLTLLNVTWAILPSTDTEAYALLLRQPRGANRVRVEVIEMLGCTEVWIGLPLVCLLGTSHILCANDLVAIVKLAQRLTVGEAGHPAPVARATSVERGYGACCRGRDAPI